VIGFVHKPDPVTLVRLAKRRKVMCVEDLGSGLLVDLSAYGIDEPTVQQGVKAGMDIVTFSGDKLLGGPQCGIILGKSRYLDELKSNPLMRALRVDKMTLSALSATLSAYLYSDNPLEHIPHLRMIAEPESAVKARARRMAKAIDSQPDYEVTVIRSRAAVGGGSCPGLEIPSWSVRMKPLAQSVQRLARTLREQTPPVIGIVSEGALHIDMRTILRRQTNTLTKTLKAVMA
jgi:L-seryl-tRNA(Ser) seleniumtransferase